MSKIAAVVVTYNRKVLLTECLQALLVQTEQPSAILVIDNHSTDGTREQIREYIDSGAVSYFDTGENLGGAGGFSFGIRKAVELGYDDLWLMDDDTIPEPDALAALVKAAQQLPEGWGFLSGKALWTDGNICRMNAQKLYGKKPEEVQAPTLCSRATFVSFFLSSDTVREVGLPIKEFFIWGDDWEYSRRISAKKKSYYVPSSIVVHKTANNVGSNIAKDRPERLPRYRYAYRNEVYIARQEGWKRCIYQVLKVLYHLLRVLFLAESQKGARMKIIVQSSLEGLSFNPEIERI